MQVLNRLTLAFIALAPVASALQASNFNVSAEVAEASGCGSECYRIMQIANQADLATVNTNYGFDFDFYATASNFSVSSPGDLLKLQPLDPASHDTTDGTTAYRFQYTSKDLDDTIVPVTGFIAFPWTPLTHDQKFPLVAYAHGTIGVYRGCAPSAGPALFDYGTWAPIVSRGYAVVATDYAGLGNNYTTHKYCSFPAHVNDLYYSVIAARKAFGHILSEEWMSVGHSQGGGAVWKLAESKFVQTAVNGAGRYLGTVAISPATRILDMYREYARELSANTSKFRPYVIAAELPSFSIGLSRVLPNYDFGMLGKTLKQRLGLMDEAQSCTNAMMGMTLDLNIEDLINPEGGEDERIQKWQQDTAPGSGRSQQPLLVIQGLGDTGILPSITRKTWERSCRNGNEVHLREYDGVEHSPTPPTSAPEWLAWMGEIFAGKNSSCGCDLTKRSSMDMAHVKSPPEFDYAELGITFPTN
ncbi:Alpha/Beta hydrolase protein [Truncatella angustata]|uniref:Alpha/Beta hydrolase protein n=1 Tax=Truncatella angustata TaxID=152316 RepID=A0A9P8UNP5_9PEZI|nr:Alpha/Beta hydrolase protein [Truncatella angustata]KAH6656039.1 Alpha/Beta hydrolase protein [Truncatella angustata]KAH8198388.1 hypothetical protein TruAng_007423 [Truncatella angustata]